MPTAYFYQPCRVARARRAAVAALLLGIGVAVWGNGGASAAAPPAGGGRPLATDWFLGGVWRTYANADDVRAMALDGDELWVATASGGVARWNADGTLARHYLAPQDGLPSNDVRDLARWRGRWWFATSGGLAVYDPAHDRMERLAAGLASWSVTCLAVDGADRLWVGLEPWWDPAATFEGKPEPGGWTGGGVAVTSDGASWQAMGVAEGLPSMDVRDVLAWQGTVWLATEPYQGWRKPGDDGSGNPRPGGFEAMGGGLAELTGDGWRVYDGGTSTEISGNARLLASRGDTLFVGTGGRGLLAYQRGKWKALRDCGDLHRCIQDDYVTALAVSADGAVWVGTARFNGRGTGLGVLDDGGTPTNPDDDAWYAYGAVDGLPAELVHAILPVGADASLWIAVADLDPQSLVHGAGLVHLLADRRSMERRSSVTAGSGAPAGNDITAVARDAATGELWIGTAGSGVSVLSAAGRWRSYTRASTGGGLASDDVADIAVEPGGTVWIATRQTTYDAGAGAWADGGLSRFDGAAWQRFGTADGLPSTHVSALALDRAGRLWVGTGATDRGPKEDAYRGWGLAVVNTATLRWERTYTYPTLTSNNITDLVVTGDLLWVATSYFLYASTAESTAVQTGGGVSVFNVSSGTWGRITAENGLTPALPASSSGGTKLVDARALYADPAGALWVGGSAYASGELEAAQQPDGVVDVVTTDRVTVHRFPGTGAVRAVSADPSGVVWAATRSGGLRLWVGDQWLEWRVMPGGLPTDRLNVLAFGAEETWLGTADSGLLALLALHDDQPAPDEPTPEPAPVVRLAVHVYLPAAGRHVLDPVSGP